MKVEFSNNFQVSGLDNSEHSMDIIQDKKWTEITL